ncbi:MAG: non-homologous end-joining DNA ligase [Marmoricola sp.]
MRPMLATRGQQPPLGSDWLHEIKWDGYRALVEVRSGVVTVTSRTERTVTGAFPEFGALADLPGDVVLDGEIVVFREGVPVLHGVAERFQVSNQQRAAALAEVFPATFMVFDLLECLGESILDRPLEQRRQLLEVLPLETTEVARISPAYDDPTALMEAVRAQGLEGIVSKRRLSSYRPGVRSPDWLKFPLRDSASFVIGGYRWEKGSRHRIGSLMLGEPTADGIVYRGRVGLAVPARTERDLAQRLEGTELDAPALIDVPGSELRDTTWVRPELVVDVEFLERTADGRLRHPTYRGVRGDLAPSDLA